jgi:hypothetical protein
MIQAMYHACSGKAPHAPLAQSAEHIHGKDGVGGSIPPGGSTYPMTSANAGRLSFRDRGADHIRIGMWPERRLSRRSVPTALTSLVAGFVLLSALVGSAPQRSEST